MNKHSFFEQFSTVACLVAASAVLIVFLVACGEEPEEPDPDSETSASVETDVDSATETVPSANMEPGDKFIFPSEGLVCVERVYYDAGPTPETVKVVYLRAPENAVDLVIPEGVEAIGDKAFSTCQKLERVSLPASLKSIGRLAFLNCSSLREISIPNGVMNYAYDAFFGTPCKESVRREMESRLAAVQP